MVHSRHAVLSEVVAVLRRGNQPLVKHPCFKKRVEECSRTYLVGSVFARRGRTSQEKKKKVDAATPCASTTSSTPPDTAQGQLSVAVANWSQAHGWWSMKGAC